MEEIKESGEKNVKVVYKSVNILKEKQSSKGVKKKETAVKVRQPQPESSSSDTDGIILIIEDPSVHAANESMHSYSKFAKASAPKLKKGSNAQEEQEENIKKNTRRKRKVKDESSENTTINLVEEVACFKCKFCSFLSLNQDAVASHVEQEHASSVPDENNIEMQCPGCSNVFFSQNSLKVHLSEDHNVAPEELDSILSSFQNSDLEITLPQNTRNGKRRKQEESSFDEVGESVVESPYLGPDSQNYIVAESSSKFKRIVVGKQKMQQLCISDPLPFDETGKIRVRKLFSLESSKKGSGSSNDKMANLSSSKAMKVKRTASSSTSDRTHAATPLLEDIGLIENQSEVSNEDDIPVTIEYDIDAIQILDIPLEQEQPQESEDERNLQSTDGFQVSCEEIIDGICQEQVLTKVLYSQQAAPADDHDSSLLESYSSQISQVPGTGTSAPESREKAFNMERVILSSCTLDGSNLVGAGGKKLVKRGYIKRQPVKKNQARKQKTKTVRSTRAKKSSAGGEQTSKGAFKCNFVGCGVRLHLYDNLQYHEQCHILLDVTEEGDIQQSAAKSLKEMDLPGKSKFSCPECAMVFKTWKLLKTHLWKSHSIDMELYSCDQCGYKSPSITSMNFHEKIHGTEKPYLCDTCGKGFKTPKQLQNHKTIHVKKVALETCEICGRGFNSSRMLRNHINTVHNKVRPYMCSECGHTAANRSSLKMHLRQHTGDRPYRCDHCDYTTADHNSLRRHKQRHTGDKPYKCPHCTYACIQSSTYKIHLRTKHPGQDVGLTFSCKKCPFNSVNRDMFLAHNAEHDLAEACGIPFKSLTRASLRRAVQQCEDAEENVSEEIPIFVSITDDTSGCEAPNFENLVHHVSEAIVPGSNFHVLYNSISMPDSNSKAKLPANEHSANATIGQDSVFQLVGESGLELVVAEDEMPSEEMDFKLRDEKTES